MPLHLTDLKARIIDYLHHLSLYDYIAYGWLGAFLIVLILLSVLLAKRSPGFSLTLILIVLILMSAGPFGIKYLLDQTVRNVTIIDRNVTELPFSKNLIVLGNIRNNGKIDLRGCRVFVDIVRKDQNKYLTMLYRLKPIRKMMLKIEKPLKQDGMLPYKVVFDHFALPKKRYAVRQKVECF